MNDCQQANVKKKGGYAERIVALAIFVIVLFFFAVMRLSEKGVIKPDFVLGVCGFKQRYGLPCPGCGWTHSAQAFAAGDVVRSFVLQPAAAVFCGLLVFIAVLALHTLIFGVHSQLRRVLTDSRFWKVSLIVLGVVVALGWIVTLARAFSSGGGL